MLLKLPVLPPRHLFTKACNFISCIQPVNQCSLGLRVQGSSSEFQAQHLNEPILTKNSRGEEDGPVFCNLFTCKASKRRVKYMLHCEIEIGPDRTDRALGLGARAGSSGPASWLPTNSAKQQKLEGRLM